MLIHHADATGHYIHPACGKILVFLMGFFFIIKVKLDHCQMMKIRFKHIVVQRHIKMSFSENEQECSIRTFNLSHELRMPFRFQVPIQILNVKQLFVETN